MSFWGKFNSFFHAFGSELERLFGNASYAQKAAAVINYAAPVVEMIVQDVAGTDAEKEAESIIETIKTDLATVSALVQGGTPDAGSTVWASLKKALDSAKANLTSILQLAAIKNHAKVDKITSGVNLVVGELDALLGGLPTS
jgi:hypothetical protein